ncbi:Uncharacterized conserved protein, contains ParB-like and HNH nuclease domains [Kosakonia radicincitans]|uniref:DUF262 domain-containing protein n=1 Tax=Kosakonia radicincitans TaxID=283686 RepID=UPI0009C2D0FD|nr:DUF262 domain-containing protein [Kosakonia radicincitans]SKC23179.1 Uncharacterized conserved protein, contains ParB-like and HNH nuclease domains [Kosakonia radicincitans]
MSMTHEQKYVSTCLQQKFSLPTYQRDYKWDYNQLQDLMSDIQGSFLAQWDESHGRESALGYNPYFLGTIIVAPGENGEHIIVDGQQRLTTLIYVLCYFHRYSLLNPEAKVSPLDSSIRRKLAGKNTFNLKMDPNREELFNVLLEGELDDVEFSTQVDSISNKDSGTLKIWSLYQRIESLIEPEIINNNLVAHFVDYLTERVYLYQIGVSHESDGHKVFVTMNDRGLKLSPIDLLKGFLLSGITEPSRNNEAHKIWLSIVNKLNELGNDEAAGFLKTWLRSKHAQTNRARKSTEDLKDFDVISSSYHRWVIDNKRKIGLVNSDDYHNLITKELLYFSDVYIKIKKHEKTFTKNFEYAYYNGSRDLTSQAMIIMAAISKDDSKKDAETKIKIVSYYLDVLATLRYLSDKSNTYDALRDVAFKIIMDLRGKNVDDIKGILFSKIKIIEPKLFLLKNIKYDKNNRKLDLLRLLSRIACYLEEQLFITNAVSYKGYVNRQLDHKTFDIEHLFADKYNAVNSYLTTNAKVPFSTREEFTKSRNNIGALILLPRGRNRSLKDAMYDSKLAQYSNENVLAQTLTPGFYLNQPNYGRFQQNTGLSCSSVPVIEKDTIKERADFYLSVAFKIWSLKAIELKFGSAPNVNLNVTNDID